MSPRKTVTLLAVVLALVSCLGLARAQADVSGLPPQPQCARTCHEVQCDGMGIRYGKYCGVGHGGCPGEKPCDSIDKCCMRHDSCVEKTGLMAANGCHESFIRCLENNKHKDDGFSNTCPYEVIVPAMKQGIEMAMMFTKLASGLDNLAEL